MDKFEEVDALAALVAKEAAGGGGSQPVQVAEKTLLAADVLDLDTPYEIIPDPGVDKYLLPFAAFLRLNNDGTEYDPLGGTLSLAFDDNNGNNWAVNDLDPSILSTAPPAALPLRGDDGYFQTVVDPAFLSGNLVLVAPSPPTGGTASLSVAVYYTVVDLS